MIVSWRIIYSHCTLYLISPVNPCRLTRGEVSPLIAPSYGRPCLGLYDNIQLYVDVILKSLFANQWQHQKNIVTQKHKYKAFNSSELVPLCEDVEDSQSINICAPDTFAEKLKAKLSLQQQYCSNCKHMFVNSGFHPNTLGLGESGIAGIGEYAEGIGLCPSGVQGRSSWSGVWGRSPHKLKGFCCVKAKFHYASWFGASSEPASVMEFGFK